MCKCTAQYLIKHPVPEENLKSNFGLRAVVLMVPIAYTDILP